jgi:hypothetical protein
VPLLQPSHKRWISLNIAILLLPTLSTSKSSKPVTTVLTVTGQGPAVLWREPQDIRTRNLFYGSGGMGDQPPGDSFIFLKEDLEGSNPKLDVMDADGTKWKLKMGIETRSETVASRLVWAVGYQTEEYYFVPAARIKEMPRLQRGRKYVQPDGTVFNVRLKRTPEGEKKIGVWEWSQNPFTGTRELNGLRVLMALINNWDLKDENNAILQLHGAQDDEVYVVSDLGSSFGTVGFGWSRKGSKGNLKAYEHSKFVKDVTGDTVSFYTPARAAWDHLFPRREWRMRQSLRWIGRDIPRTDARWMGQLLGRLSDAQIKEAFRAAQYSNVEIDRFSRVVEKRIAELQRL